MAPICAISGSMFQTFRIRVAQVEHDYQLQSCPYRRSSEVHIHQFLREPRATYNSMFSGANVKIEIRPYVKGATICDQKKTLAYKIGTSSHIGHTRTRQNITNSQPNLLVIPMENQIIDTILFILSVEAQKNQILNQHQALTESEQAL